MKKRQYLKEWIVLVVIFLIIFFMFRIMLFFFSNETCAYISKESTYKGSHSFEYYFKIGKKTKNGFILKYRSKIKSLKKFKAKGCVKITYVSFFPYINRVIDKDVIYD